MGRGYCVGPIAQGVGPDTYNWGTGKWQAYIIEPVLSVMRGSLDEMRSGVKSPGP